MADVAEATRSGTHRVFVSQAGDVDAAATDPAETPAVWIDAAVTDSAVTPSAVAPAAVKASAGTLTTNSGTSLLTKPKVPTISYGALRETTLTFFNLFPTFSSNSSPSAFQLFLNFISTFLNFFQLYFNFFGIF